MEPVLQVALDHMHLKRALLAAAEAVEGGADWLEAGTPLIKSEGMEVVRQLKKTFPGTSIGADARTMGTGAFEVEIAAKAGADVVTVMGVTDDATILEAVKAARPFRCRPTIPFESTRIRFAGFAPAVMRIFAVRMFDAPAPIKVSWTSDISFPTTLRALITPATLIVAVPCWSSCQTAISHSFRSR